MPFSTAVRTEFDHERVCVFMVMASYLSIRSPISDRLIGVFVFLQFPPGEWKSNLSRVLFISSIVGRDYSAFMASRRLILLSTCDGYYFPRLSGAAGRFRRIFPLFCFEIENNPKVVVETAVFRRISCHGCSFPVASDTSFFDFPRPVPPILFFRSVSRESFRMY